MLIQLALADIERAALNRPPGYLSALMSTGTVRGEWLEIDDQALAGIDERYGVIQHRCSGCGG